jgi:hypothetical protein
MKKLLLLLIVTFVGISVYAQIPEKANTITITLPDSNNVNEKILKVLNSKDYTLKSGEKNATVINTAPKTLKNNTRVSLNIQVKGTDLILTGMILIATEGSKRIEYKGTKGTPIMSAWEEMDKVAKAFGGKMKYEVK